MSWDERLFSLFYDWVKKSKDSIKNKYPSLELETVRRQGEVFLSALCESKIEIRESSGLGGFQGHVLFLPENINYFSSIELNYLYLEWRLLVASIDFQKKGLKLELESVMDVVNAFPKLNKVYETLKRELGDKEQEVNYAFWLGHSDWKNTKDFTVIDEDLKAGLLKSTDNEGSSSGTEKQGKTKDRAKVVNLKSGDDNPLMHVFEKVFTAEDYQGGQKKMDGSDELEMHSAALDELNLSHVIRTQLASQSVLKSNAIIDIEDSKLNDETVLEGPKVYHYPEWFSGRREYKKDWCTVYETVPSEAETLLPFNNKVAEALKHKIESIMNSYQWKTRQREGPEIDINLALDRHIRLLSGEGHLPENVYRRKLKENHDFAIQILVDSSLSADSYAQGRRIIETTQEALNIFTDAFTGVLDFISIAAFSSHTRNRVQYQIIKDFKEPWSRVPYRVASLKPEGYTRIGPALRHSRTRLEKVSAKKKLLLFISDAKPTDYDFYEGQHGVDDIQRAVTELHSSQCFVKVLTLTDQKHSHHNYVFGANHCRILKGVEELSDSLFDFWYQAIR